MDINNLLPHLIRLKGQANITVEGFSMEPTLFAGDVVTVCLGEYRPGDILVFYYKEGSLLIHRLLYIKNDRYFCKGDNAFRVEDFTQEQLVGKVALVNGRPSELWPDWKTALSATVGKEFRRCHYEENLIKESKIYQLYQALVLKRKEVTIMYVKNKAFTFILTDETSMVVFDPKTGNTHLLDEVGISILDCLNEPITIELLLETLCKEYAATPEEICGDVEEFLADMVQKEVVVLV